jgi:cyclic nucleotide gated channel
MYFVLLQKYLQSTTGRVEEMLLKRDRIRQYEQWMTKSMLPHNLRERIRRCEQFKWQETRGVEEENLIRNLPKYLRMDIKRHLCLHLLKRVSVFLHLIFSFFLSKLLASDGVHQVVNFLYY